MYNKVILVGNLTRDIEIRYTQSGTAIGKVGIATNRRFKNAQGEQQDETMFIDLTFFGRTAEIANQYLHKGSKVLVEGRLVLEQWNDQAGNKRSKHSVTVENMQMLGGRDDNSQGGYGGAHNSATPSHAGHGGDASASVAPSAQEASAQPTPAPNVPEIDIDEEEIPF
jgi:single-strand DNA-binding protein